LDRVQSYAWPGNIRELEHALRHAVAMSESATLRLSDFPDAIQLALQGRPRPAAALAEVADGSATGAARVVDPDQLRMAIRATDPKAVAVAAHKHELPCHIEFARKEYLGALIDECNGDLALIGQYWDRHSEKTLRNLIRQFGLETRLEAARKNRGATMSA
jgi:DNA-binding NtrC family response regulator